MTQRESRLSRKIMTALREQGVFCFKVHGSEHMMAGLPDIICCIDGWFVGMETKHQETRNNLSPRQEFVHDQIRSADGYVAIVCSIDEALKVVEVVRSA